MPYSRNTGGRGQYHQARWQAPQKRAETDNRTGTEHYGLHRWGVNQMLKAFGYAWQKEGEDVWVLYGPDGSPCDDKRSAIEACLSQFYAEETALDIS